MKIQKLFNVFFLIREILMSVRVDGGATIEIADALHTDLKAGYNKFIRPVKDQDIALMVNISMRTIAIQEFDEVQEKFSVVTIILITWVDERMTWNQTDYEGLRSVHMGYKDMWVPEVILINPSSKIDSFGKEWQLIRYYSDGTAVWFPGELIKATCSMNVKYFPFDVQECNIRVYCYGYSVDEVQLHAPVDFVDISQMENHGSWTVIGTRASTAVLRGGSLATFTFHLERKPQYIIINVILPISFLCLLNSLVFLLPVESGERVSYAITVLLSITVFMTVVSDTLPKVSEPVSLYSYFLMINLILSSLITVVVILNLKIFYKNNETPLPAWLENLYGCLKCGLPSKLKMEGSKLRLEDNEDCKDDNKIHKIIADESIASHKRKAPSKNVIETEISAQPINQSKSIAIVKPVTWINISNTVDILAFVISFILNFSSCAIFFITAKVYSKT